MLDVKGPSVLCGEKAQINKVWRENASEICRFYVFQTASMLLWVPYQQVLKINVQLLHFRSQSIEKYFLLYSSNAFVWSHRPTNNLPRQIKLSEQYVLEIHSLGKTDFTSVW